MSPDAQENLGHESTANDFQHPQRCSQHIQEIDGGLYPDISATAGVRVNKG